MASEHGPAYDYYAEPSKSALVIKKRYLQEAQDIFADLQVKVVLTSSFLGCCVDSTEGIRQYVTGKVNTWTKGVEQLAKAAKVYPQSVCPAFTWSLSCEWSYLQRVTYMYACDEECSWLRDVIRSVFTTVVLGREVLQMEHALFSYLLRLAVLLLLTQ